MCTGDCFQIFGVVMHLAQPLYFFFRFYCFLFVVLELYVPFPFLPRHARLIGFFIFCYFMFTFVRFFFPPFLFLSFSDMSCFRLRHSLLIFPFSLTEQVFDDYNLAYHGTSRCLMQLNPALRRRAFDSFLYFFCCSFVVCKTEAVQTQLSFCFSQQ